MKFLRLLVEIVELELKLLGFGGGFVEIRICTGEFYRRFYVGWAELGLEFWDAVLMVAGFVDASLEFGGCVFWALELGLSSDYLL